jgi:hypothetical protein
MHHPASPTLFVNVFEKDGRTFAEGDVYIDRRQAIEDAEEWSDNYVYTLTDTGKLDLSPEFSEGFQERRDFDAAVDAKIDAMRERA